VPVVRREQIQLEVLGALVGDMLAVDPKKRRKPASAPVERRRRAR
jgi:hypothetical protein